MYECEEEKEKKEKIGKERKRRKVKKNRKEEGKNERLQWTENEKVRIIWRNTIENKYK